MKDSIDLSAENPYAGNGSGSAAPVKTKKSNPLILIMITLISVAAGIGAGLTIEMIDDVNRQVPPWVFGTQIGSIVLFFGHMGYQLYLVFKYPDHEDE